MSITRKASITPAPAAPNDAPALALAAQLVALIVGQARGLVRDEVLAALDAQAKPPALITRDELARELGVCAKTVGKLIGEGLPLVRVGGAERFDLGEVLGWLRSRRSDP